LEIETDDLAKFKQRVKLAISFAKVLMANPML
jgi:hypothetical protein